MKVAVYLIGQPRMISTCVPYYRDIFECLNPDWYILNWDTVEGKYIGKPEDNKLLVEPQKIKETYYKILPKENIKELVIQHPVDIYEFSSMVESFKNIITRSYNGDNIIKDRFSRYNHYANYISQHHCSDLCNRLRIKKDIDYDLIIRLRTDLIFDFFYKKKQYQNEIISQIQLLKKKLEQYKNTPLLIIEKLKFYHGCLRTSDSFYMGNPKGIDYITNNVMLNWLCNIFQYDLKYITGYKSNQFIPAIDQHSLFLSNIIFRGDVNELEQDKQLEIFDLVDLPFTKLFCKYAITRYNYNKEDSFEEIYQKNTTYIQECIKNKNDNISQKVTL